MSRGVLEGAFALLEAVERHGQAGLTALAADTGLPKTTVHRLLEQLTELGAVQRSGTEYRLGPQIFRLAQGWQPHPRLGAAARDPMRWLARTSGATVGVCVLSRGQTLVVDAVPGAIDSLAPMRAGMTWPWTTAAGKALAAGKGLTAGGGLGRVPPGWAREARMIQERGVAFDDEELIDGVCCVAVPLHAGRETVAVLCALTGPSSRKPALTDTVERIGRSIGARLRPRTAPFKRLVSS